MAACLQNFQAAIYFLMKWYIWERLMKLSIQKKFISNAFLDKKNWNVFLPCTHFAIKLVYVVAL